MKHQFKRGTPVRISFTPAHKKEYPNYCARWEGKFGEACITSNHVSSRGFVRVRVEGTELCIEHDNLRRLPQVVR